MQATISLKTAGDRWKALTIGVVCLSLFLLYGMTVYRDVDVGFYSELPDAVRKLMGIPPGADVGGLAYGAMYGFAASLTMASLALSMGSASIASEERNGTMGLLLGNPKSRTHVLASKALTMVVLIGLGSLVLWGTGHVVPALLDVSITGIHVGSLMIHIFVNALFYGFLAMGIGAWTGNGTVASGATAGVMVLSYFAVGLLPLAESLASVARIFPWYYFDSSQPLINGASWGHLTVLLIGIVVFAVVAVVGVNRRDLRSQTVGATLIDRLRANPRTQKVVERLAGSTRVSHIWIKTASEHQGLLIVTAYTMFLMMGVIIGPFYALLDEDIKGLADQLPEVLLAMVGNGDLSTPEGFYQIETFSLMAPIAVMVVTVVIASRALAGEEERRTIGLLLANPIKRSKIIIEKSVTMVLYAFVVGFATFAGVALGSMFGGLGLDVGNIAATSLLVTLLGLVFGALALAIGAARGHAKVAANATIGTALALYLVNSFVPLNDSISGLAQWSPFYYYLTSDPLTNGMHWGHAGVLAALAVILIAVSVPLFDKRDLRQIA